MRTVITSLATAVALASSISICSAARVQALESVQERTSVTEQTTSQGEPTIIQHIDSKMEPTVVQSKLSTDAATGEKTKVVEPIIMERHDRVLDTTIVQPKVTEVTKTTEQVVTDKIAAPAVTTHKSVRIMSSGPKHIARKPVHKVHHVAAVAPRKQTAMVAPTQTTKINQTTEIIRQPSVEQTFIRNTQPDSPPEPQVIQKVESK